MRRCACDMREVRAVCPHEPFSHRISRGGSRELFHLAFDVAQALGRWPFRRPGLLHLRRHLTCRSQGRYEAAAIFTALKKMAMHGRRSQQRLKRFRRQGQLHPTPAPEGVDNTRPDLAASLLEFHVRCVLRCFFLAVWGKPLWPLMC